jgi:hypothetical protein
MKRILFLPLFAMMALLFSCSNDEENNMPKTDDRVFTGKLLLNGSLIDDATRCELNVVAGTASITIYGVKFAPAMPAMDITMPMLDCKKSGDGYAISGKDVLPLVAGTPMTAFMVSSLEASLSGDKFVVSAETALGTIGFSNVSSVPATPSGSKYRGMLQVGEFSKEVLVNVVRNNDAGTLDMVINDVKFAANMPLELDITLKDIPFVSGLGISFIAENVAPYINTEGEPAAAYMFAVVEGNINGGRLTFTAKMADNLAPYVAGKEFVFSGEGVVE